jgi:hypothetical protein
MSAPINDGGPAYPWPDPEHNMGAEGMSLRAYFMAHAPAEPQPWFAPRMPARPQPPERPRSQDLTPDASKELDGLNDWLNTEDVQDPNVKSFAEAMDAYRLNSDAWAREQKRERYLQWPGAWADEMIKRSRS